MVPIWGFYRSHLKLTQIDTKTGKRKILRDEPGELPDGPSQQLSKPMEELKNPSGTFNAYALDAPRYGDDFHENKKYRYELTGEWRLTIKDKVNEWEAKIRVSFSFDDNADPGTADGSFKILSPPTKVK